MKRYSVRVVDIEDDEEVVFDEVVEVEGTSVGADVNYAIREVAGNLPY